LLLSLGFAKLAKVGYSRPVAHGSIPYCPFGVPVPALCVAVQATVPSKEALHLLRRKTQKGIRRAVPSYAETQPGIRPNVSYTKLLK
jgi:hypothetical protein